MTLHQQRPIMGINEGRKGVVWPLSAALYVLEALIVCILVLAYRVEEKSSVQEFLISRPGLLSVLGGVAFIGTVWLVVHLCRSEQQRGSRQWILTVVMNVFVISVFFAITETSLRLVSAETNTQTIVFGKLLYPRRWPVLVERFQAILRRAEREPAFWVQDPDLGWTIGINRAAANGLYFSSAEGLRAAKTGETLRDNSLPCRIALIGDSYTFGEEVVYEHSWAFLLGEEFKDKCQVLNFGVGGYGVDQMYLRYIRDVIPWKPDAVILAFVNHDVVRTFSVYSFLLFPDGETPFSKPRFSITDDKLVQVNYPLIQPDEIFAKQSIRDLPFISYDVNYKEMEWDHSQWDIFHSSYLFRLLVSVYPLHERERPETSEASLISVNREILREFQAAVQANGSESLIVYLPSVGEVPEKTWWEPIALKIMREGNIPHLDLRDCMASKYHEEMFMPVGHGQHYSPRGNEAVAACLKEPIRHLLADRPEEHLLLSARP